jgi:hypothetical protein
MKLKKDEKKKRDWVIQSLLARITDYQLQSQDEKFFNWCEDLRHAIVEFKQKDN